MTRRRLPAPSRAHATCHRCGRAIVWATTVASPRGRGGKSQAFDPYEDPNGNVAVSNPHRAQLLARALAAEELGTILDGELRAMPHAATCPGERLPIDVVPPGVIDLAVRRQQRGRR